MTAVLSGYNSILRCFKYPQSLDSLRQDEKLIFVKAAAAIGVAVAVGSWLFARDVERIQFGRAIPFAAICTRLATLLLSMFNVAFDTAVSLRIERT